MTSDRTQFDLHIGFSQGEIVGKVDRIVICMISGSLRFLLAFKCDRLNLQFPFNTNSLNFDF